MPRKVTRGTGITAREVTMFDMTGKVPGDGALMKASARRWNDMIDEGGGIFGAVSLQASKSAKHILAETSAEGESYLEDSPRDFAYQIDKFIEAAKHEIENGNADIAARCAFSAGMKWAQATMKWNWEREALVGHKQLMASEDGAKARKGKLAPHTLHVISEMARLIKAGYTQSSAARIAAANGIGESYSANQKAWYRHSKKQ